ncbi:MAG: DUF3783 domain-containing protein [Spirochaeta sp.]|nr:DUF3783 domain-containing protein [Spirochaeta sp.]
MGNQKPEQREAPELQNRVVLLNGFTNEELDLVMRAVRSAVANPRQLIFAKTTPTSIEMKLKDLLVDISQDHEYLRKNPPPEVVAARDAAAARKAAAGDSAAAAATADKAESNSTQEADEKDKRSG